MDTAASTAAIAAIALSSEGTTMEHLPDETLKHIFRYSDPRTLLSCVRSCTRFRTVLDDDDGMWRYSCGKHSDLSVGASFREKAFIGTVLREIKQSQGMGGRENIILSCLSTELIRRITQHYIVPFMNNGPDHPRMTFDVRGDALRYALDILEPHMVQKLESALLISLRASIHGNGDYPRVIDDDMRLVEEIQRNRIIGRMLLESQSHHSQRDLFKAMLREAIMRESSDDIVFRALASRIANRAGVVKMTDGVMTNIGYGVFMILANLLWRPMLMHKDMLRFEAREFEYSSIDLWNDIPPTIIQQDPQCLLGPFTVYHCVIVPGQIEVSAAKLGLYNLYNRQFSSDDLITYG